ncbi:MAG TPA: helix-turn-helix transcriptional regulator [Acidimicrobiales bacterium]|nr:helix-turn-helix transcriptional regulator [Acidimicrobiales bacterium]
MATPKGEREHRWRDLGAYIREQRRLGSLSLRNVSERAGISNPYLSQIERGLRKPSAEIIQRIARALEISSETLYVRAGILDERTDAVDVAEGLARDPHLTDEQRRELLGLYWGYRRQNRVAGELDGAAGPTGGGLTGLGPGDVESHAGRGR